MVGFEVVVAAVVYRLGPALRVRIDWAHPGPWLERTPPEEALVAVASFAVRAISWWLLAASALSLAARAANATTLARGLAGSPRGRYGG